MSSSVFFKFKSQQEMSRVTFDGTGISVFELKRQIITIHRLGDGTDFDLAINHQETGEGMYILRWWTDYFQLMLFSCNLANYL